jgi:hypothetical protein
MIRFCLFLSLCFCSVVTRAVDSVSFSVKQIAAGQWHIQDAELSISELKEHHHQLTLLSGTMQLPAPLGDLKVIEMRCNQFQWQENELSCDQGKGRIESAQLHSPTFDFSFQVQDSQGIIKISNLKLLGGNMQLTIREHAGAWQVKGNGHSIKLGALKLLFDNPEIQDLQGKANVNFSGSGEWDELRQLSVDLTLRQVRLQSQDSKIAGEGLTVTAALTADRNNKGWRGKTKLSLSDGALYIEPMYLEVTPEKMITVRASGAWKMRGERLVLQTLKVVHQKVGELTGSALLSVSAKPTLRGLDATVQIQDLTTVAPIYIAPYLEAGPLEGIGLSGNGSVQVVFDDSGLSRLNLYFTQLGVTDPEQRFQLTDGQGQINWSQAVNDQESIFNWREVKLKAIPVGPGGLRFSTYGKQLDLLHNAAMPVLGGTVTVDDFGIKIRPGENPDVYFSGSVNSLSLSQLSSTLGWTPLTGNITGSIPSVTYQDKTLRMNGALTMHLFDGNVTVTKLASSGMFTDFAQFYADIAFTNLDLKAITNKFQFGSIEGRLSGFARDLYLENWHPISFYAWVGTPEDDDSRHRISQKAVENIASIGGGGAADVISKGFLRFFDTFGYDKLGFGCYLNQGVCQMMGVEAAENGYYLVKGGGLPRIDVIGYNSRLDWNVLMQRLRRITSTNNVVVE